MHLFTGRNDFIEQLQAAKSGLSYRRRRSCRVNIQGYQQYWWMQTLPSNGAVLLTYTVIYSNTLNKHLVSSDTSFLVVTFEVKNSTYPEISWVSGSRFFIRQKDEIWPEWTKSKRHYASTIAQVAESIGQTVVVPSVLYSTDQSLDGVE